MPKGGICAEYTKNFIKRFLNKVTYYDKQGYMLETPRMQQYACRDNLFAADNQQGSLSDPSTTTRLAPISRVKI